MPVSSDAAQLLGLVALLVCAVKLARQVAAGMLMPVVQRGEAIRRATWRDGSPAVAWLSRERHARAWLARRGGGFDFVPLGDAEKRRKLRAWSGCVFGPRADRLRPDSRVLVWYCGNGYVAEEAVGSIRRYLDAYDLDAVVTWNVPGTSHGAGAAQTLEELVASAATAVELVVHLGGDPRRTLLHGHSLGGNLALYVQSTAFPEVGVVCDRTFRSLASIAAHVVPQLPEAGLSSALYAVGWSMRAEELLGGGGGFRLVTYHEDDEILPPRTQLRGPGAVALTRGGASPHGADLSELPQYGEVVRRVRAEFYRLRTGRVHTLF